MKILTVDNHWVCRTGLRPVLAKLDPDAQVLEAETYEKALKLASGNKDVKLVVMDLLLPDLRSLDALREMLGKLPQASLVVFSTVENRHDILQAVELGAAGFIPKTADGEEIAKAIKLVLAGEIYLPRQLLKESARKGNGASFPPGDGAPRQAISNLTARQRQVLGHLAQGMTNTKIATELGLSENTVRIHISAILRTLDLDNRTQAALLAAEYLRGANTL
jgi:DNA-binding NarL/FixJ family response regulator